MSRGTRRPVGGSVPLLVASGLAVLALAACGAGSDAPTGTAGNAPTATTTSQHLDLAHGVPSGWDQRRATLEHGGGDPSTWIRSTPPVCRHTVAPPAALASGRTRFRFSGRFRVRTRTAGQSVGLTTVENSAGEHHADLFVDARTGRCRVDLFSADSAMSTGACDDGAWHRVTMTGDYGSDTYTLVWTVDGVPMPPIRSTGQPAATVHRLWLGDATPAKSNVTDWTDVTLELS